MTLPKPLAVLAVEEVAHRPPPSFVRFHQNLAFIGVLALLRYGGIMFRYAARWAAVGKSGFIRLQFELFRADRAHFDRKCHLAVMIQPTQFSLMQKEDFRTGSPVVADIRLHLSQRAARSYSCGNAVPAIHLCGWLLPHGCGLRGSGKSELQTYLIRTTSRLYDCGLHGSERLDLSVKGGCVPRTVDGAADIDEIGGVGQGDPTVYHQSRTCRCLSVGGKREFHRCERRLPHVHRTAAAIGGIKIAPRVDEAVTSRINSVGESDIPSHQIG